jgi:hypothetical protein
MTRSTDLGRADLGRTDAPRPTPLLVHCHLRWDFVWQRPQQLLSRFAQHAPVLFVEEAVFADDLAAGTLDISTPAKGVTRV